jgi:hypothetical protein
MTELLERAIAQLKILSPTEQDAMALAPPAGVPPNLKSLSC